jgi:hypothetical protein
MENQRVDFVDHKGKRILLIDFTQLGSDAYTPLVERIRTLVFKEPKSSVLSLIDASGMLIDIKAVQALKNLANDDKPYVRASAVVGVAGPLGLLMDGVEKFSGRAFRRFDSREQAMDWLARQ